ADHGGAAVVLQHALEITQEFRHPVAPEIRRTPPRRRPLLLEIETARHRMVGAVDMGDEVGDGELQLMRPQSSRLVARCQIEPRTEIEQNIRGLGNDDLAGFEKRRRVRRPRAASVLEQFHHRRHAALARMARDIDIIGSGLFEREADELPAALYARPVVKFVAHRLSPARYPTAALYCSSVTGSNHSTCLPSSASCMATCIITVAGPAPCQCFSPGGIQTTSPARISRTLPPQLCTRPQPDMTHKVCPSGWVCQWVRAPGSKRTMPERIRAGAGASMTGSCQTTPVKESAGPRRDGREPQGRMSMVVVLQWRPAHFLRKNGRRVAAQ